MSKYIIEIKPEYEDKFKGVMILGAENSNLYVDSNTVDELEELTADYINEHFGSLQDEAYKKGINDGSLDVKQRVEGAYQRGLDDAWECARKLFSSMADSDIEKAFPVEWNNGGFNALINLQPQEAIAKLKAYEEKQKEDNDKFEFGDEIIDSNGVKGCVISMNNEKSNIMYALFGGYRVPQCICQKNYRKTGKHYDVDDIKKLLEEMRHD